MAQPLTDAKSLQTAKQAVAAAPKSKLILQDPLAFDQATQPALRASMELVVEPSVASMEREQARNLWESLSLEPEVAQARQIERKKLLLVAENTKRELAIAKAQALELQAQLTKSQDERFNHPVVYAGAATLIGLVALWSFERRRRMQSHQREVKMLARQSLPLAGQESVTSAAKPADADHSYLPQQGRVFSLEDSPDLANDFATDLMGSPDSQMLDLDALKPAPIPIPVPAAQPIAATASVVDEAVRVSREPVFDEAPAPPAPGALQSSSMDSEPTNDLPAAPRRKQDQGLLAASKQVFSNILNRRAERGDFKSEVMPSEAPASSNNHQPTMSSLNHGYVDEATQMLYDEEAQEAFEQELLAHQLSAGLHANYDRSYDDIQSSSPTQMLSQVEESTMEYLLELRTTASGLCALGRIDGAVKLLEEHIAQDPSACAWVYLEHLHISEQAGLRKNFEAMRGRYLQQFNCAAPSWHESGINVLSLDSYPRETDELCAAWSRGAMHARSLVVSWLAGPVRGRKLLQLPAYADLFDLYEVLEYVDAISGTARPFVMAERRDAAPVDMNQLLGSGLVQEADAEEESEFVPTVSLLDLDFEFSSDVTLEESEVLQSEKAVTGVKPGNFSVDFNVAGTQVDALSSVQAQWPKN